jgi:hypothetical protein
MRIIAHLLDGQVVAVRHLEPPDDFLPIDDARLNKTATEWAASVSWSCFAVVEITMIQDLMQRWTATYRTDIAVRWEAVAYLTLGRVDG